AAYTDSPATMVSGVGIGTFLETVEAKSGTDQQIHNTFLWLLVEGGPLLFGAFLLIVWFAMAQTIRCLGSPGLRLASIGVFCSWTGFLTYLIANEGLYQHEFWLLLALPDVLTVIGRRIKLVQVTQIEHGNAFLGLSGG